LSDPTAQDDLTGQPRAAGNAIPKPRPRWSWWRAPDLAGIDSFWREQHKRPWWSWWHLIELAAVFALGACLMNFLYVGTGGVLGDRLGVPGHDSYYHVKMAVLLPEIGLTHEFPWLRYCYFRDLTADFVSHHYGFHALLAPFVYAGKWLRDDYLTGGRWGISAFFAAALTLFQLILMTQRVRCRWLWLALYILMPSQFFSRQAFVRAIAPSLLFMMLIIVLMFRRRYLLTGIAVAAYTHLYMGGVIFGPLIVICYAVAGLIGPRGDRVSWRLWMWTFCGWLAGVYFHPYYEGMYEFLRLQVFGTGLTPDISVGTEWKPYDKVWWVAGMCGWTLIPLAASICLRLRLGPRINARELSVLLMNLVFATLMLKSRRFVEYWPPFGLLSTTLLAGPLLEDWHGKAAQWFRRLQNGWAAMMPPVALACVCVGAVWGVRLAREQLRIDPLLDDWRVWSIVAAGVLLVPLARFWTESGPRNGPKTHRVWRTGVVPLAGAIFVAALVAVCWLATRTGSFGGPRFRVPWWCFAALALVYWIVPLIAQRWASGRSVASTAKRAGGMIGIATTALLVFTLLLSAAGPQIVGLQRTIRGKWDLPAIEAAMVHLKDVSPPGSVIFTDDWDIFPVYFYMNDYNHYVVGLDPKFTQHRDPLLWERYKAITRGQTPKTVEAKSRDGTRRKARAEIEDIRRYFGADYVMVDSDHMPFRRKLDDAATFCQRIYPPQQSEDAPTEDRTSRKDLDNAPYVIYRVFSTTERAEAKRAAQNARHDRARKAVLRSKLRPTTGPRSQPASQPASEPVQP